MKGERRAALCALLAAALIMTAAGIALGQPYQVFVKAATVCLECVGIG